MIYVTHDQTEALTFADKVVVMHDGRVVQIGTPEELFETPAHTFVGYFIGSPGMNLLDARVEGAGGLCRRRRRYRWAAAYGRPTGRVQIGIRPEFVTLNADEGLPVQGPAHRGRRPPPHRARRFLRPRAERHRPRGHRDFRRHDRALPSPPKRSASMPMTGA